MELIIIVALFLLWQLCIKLDAALFELRKIKELLGLLAKIEANNKVGGLASEYEPLIRKLREGKLG